MPTLKENIGPIAFRLHLVQGGNFLMGADKAIDPEADEDEGPVHEVSLSDFYLAEYPVTQDLWMEVMDGENPSYYEGPRRPVEQVSWLDALIFCNRLSLRTGHTPCYRNPDGSIYGQIKGKDDAWELPNKGQPYLDKNADGYRLPTEAEWEYAARGGRLASVGERYAGSDKLKEVGWFSDNSHGETKPVGLKMSNALGLYDMSGNVWEWCEDDWHDNYDNAPKDGRTWIDSPERGSARVGRGGRWGLTAQGCRSACRYGWYPDFRAYNVGFRLCLAPQSVG
jgi:formylglycine-generating enzyme required for sulfatase activity